MSFWTAAGDSGLGRMISTPDADESSSRSGPAVSPSAGRTATATNNGSSVRRRARNAKNRSEEVSARWASSTKSASGRSSQKFATSQYSPCSIGHGEDADPGWGSPGPTRGAPASCRGNPAGFLHQTIELERTQLRPLAAPAVTAQHAENDDGGRVWQLCAERGQ